MFPTFDYRRVYLFEACGMEFFSAHINKSLGFKTTKKNTYFTQQKLGLKQATRFGDCGRKEHPY
jgi:hypothetical protein